jgi:hypothetical protein
LTPGVHYFWIGLTDIFHEGTFVWITGEKVTYTKWYINNPDNAYKNEHFGHIEGKNRERQWNDQDNDFLNDVGNIYALCQFNL